MNDEEIPILHGPPTEKEKARLAEEARVTREKAAEAAYKKDQLELTKSSIRLTRAIFGLLGHLQLSRRSGLWRPGCRHALATGACGRPRARL